MTKRLLARVGALMGAATVSAGVLVGIAAPAQAASLGDVVLSQKEGDVNTTPISESATSAASCPTGYGENAALRIGQPGGSFFNLAPALGGGGFDTAPVAITPNRSFTTAVGGTAPAAGEWWIVIQCFSLIEGKHADEFITPITVVGDTWAIKQSATTLAVSPASPVKRGTIVTLTATVAPTAADRDVCPHRPGRIQRVDIGANVVHGHQAVGRPG